MAQVEVQTSTQASERPSPIRIKKLGHVVIQVRNLARSVRFYTEVMNFRVSDDASSGGVFLTAVGDHHTIGLFPSDGENAEMPGEGAVRLHHFAMHVVIVASVRRLIARGPGNNEFAEPAAAPRPHYEAFSGPL